MKNQLDFWDYLDLLKMSCVVVFFSWVISKNIFIGIIIALIFFVIASIIANIIRKYEIKREARHSAVLELKKQEYMEEMKKANSDQ